MGFGIFSAHGLGFGVQSQDEEIQLRSTVQGENPGSDDATTHLDQLRTDVGTLRTTVGFRVVRNSHTRSSDHGKNGSQSEALFSSLIHEKPICQHEGSL